MILIDASNITVGGGKVLLDYLLEELERRKYEFILIRKKETPIGLKNPSNVDRIIVSDSVFSRSRHIKYALHKYKPGTLLCFGNYPPPFKTGIKTITYFHNPHLLGNPIYHFTYDKYLLLRQLYLKRIFPNTDYFVFQSAYIKDKFESKYGKNKTQKNLVLPFYNEERILFYQSGYEKKDQFIYVSLPHKHKNHLFLLKVWSRLKENSLYPKLVLTIPNEESNQPLLRRIQSINADGGKIVNLGLVSFDEAMRQTAESKYTIFPSLYETMGLGLLESALLNNRVLMSDLPFARDVVEPSLFFDPHNIQSCADSVIKAMKHEEGLKATTVLMKNRITEFLEIL